MGEGFGSWKWWDVGRRGVQRAWKTKDETRSVLVGQDGQLGVSEDPGDGAEGVNGKRVLC